MRVRGEGNFVRPWVVGIRESAIRRFRRTRIGSEVELQRLESRKLPRKNQLYETLTKVLDLKIKMSSPLCSARPSFLI